MMKPVQCVRPAILSRLFAVLAIGAITACNLLPPPPASPQAGSGAASKPAALVAQTPPSKAAMPASPQAAAPAAATPAAAAAPPPPPPIMPFDEAVTFAATNLFGNAVLPEGSSKLPLVIDPLIDGNTGAQSVATQTMEQRITAMLQAKFPRYELQPFSTGSLARAPLLFIGTFTPVDKDGRNAVGPREWYRVCLALVDLHSGKIVSKGFARAKPEGVDPTPTAFFQDSPAWTPDGATDGYVRTCQGTKVGDPINPAYWDKIVAAAMINDAMNSYNAGRYEEALDLYRGIARSGGGDQLRVYNGLYLTSWKLGRKEEATQAFSKIVDYGLTQKRMAVKFLFRPGSTLFLNDQQISAQYQIWLKQIATRSGQRDACMEVSGHTSRTGPEPLNDRLSLLRAQYVTQRLDAGAPGVSKRTTAIGKGSREPISGLGTDDARDALDRRVEFKVIDCPVT
jgi:outer membrane protein OmpA-like peptidoglycan-associated protein